MADELDPRLEARLREVLRHEADALPFTLTVADVNAVRRARHSGAARLRVPVAMLASAAAIVILVTGLAAWRNATMPPVGTGPASPNPLSADLSSYAELARGIALVDGQVIARGEELVGAPASGEVMVGTIPANDYVDVVFDCRGGRIEVMLRSGDTPGGDMSTTCDPISPQTAFSMPGFDTDGAEVWVKADPGTVWRLVVGVAPSAPTPRPTIVAPADLPSYEELAAVALSTREVAQGEGQEGPTDETTEIMKLGDLWTLELAVACTGPGELVFGTTGTTGGESTASFACGEGPASSQWSLVDTAAERKPGAALIVTVPAGTAWRVIVFDRTPIPETAPVAPAALFPTTLQGGYQGELEPGAIVTIDAPLPPDASTLEVAMGCAGDPDALVRITVDGVTADLACHPTNTWRYIPAGKAPAKIKVVADRQVVAAIEVRSFTREQAGAVVAVPDAILTSAEGASAAPGFITCVKAFAIPGGASADEGCGPTPYQIPDARAVRARAGESLVLSDGIDWTITSAAAITYVPSSAAGTATPGETVRHPDGDGPMADGWISVKPLPVGDWTLRMDVSGTLADGTTFTAEQLFRVIVEP